MRGNSTNRYPNGRIGQVVGPFDSSDLLGRAGSITLSTEHKLPPKLLKLGVVTDAGTILEINGDLIKVSRTGMYELTDGRVNIRSFRFPNGAPNSDTIVDFIY